MEKVWKPVVGYEESYEVSNYGEIRGVDRYVSNGKGLSLKRGVIKSLKTDKDGYFRVYLSKNSKKKQHLVHRLVAQAFLGNVEEKPCVNHIDGDKQNNYVNNLEWVTRSENDLHAFKLGLRVATDGGMSKAVVKLTSLGEVVKKYKSLTEAAKDNAVSTQAISIALRSGSKSAKHYWEYASEGVTTRQMP